MSEPIVALRLSKAAQERIIDRAFQRTGIRHCITNALRVLAGEEPVQRGAKSGDEHPKRKKQAIPGVE